MYVHILSLVILHAQCIFSAYHYILISDPSVSDIFFHIMSYTARFPENTLNSNEFWFSVQHLFEILLIVRKHMGILSWIYVGFHVMYPLLFSHLNENLSLSKFFRKTLNIKKTWKSAQWGSRIPSCVHTSKQTDGQTRHGEANSHFSYCFESN